LKFRIKKCAREGCHHKFTLHGDKGCEATVYHRQASGHVTESNCRCLFFMALTELGSRVEPEIAFAGEPPKEFAEKFSGPLPSRKETSKVNPLLVWNKKASSWRCVVCGKRGPWRKMGKHSHPDALFHLPDRPPFILRGSRKRSSSRPKSRLKSANRKVSASKPPHRRQKIAKKRLPALRTRKKPGTIRRRKHPRSI